MRTILAVFGLLMLGAFLVSSCTSNNPLAPAIKDAWGDYDYFPFGLNVAWLYDLTYPSDTVTYEFLYHIDQVGYLDPYLGYRMVISVEGIVIASPAWAVTEEEVFQNNWDENGWFLQYVTPFVLGNRWDEHVVSSIPPVTYNVDIEKEVKARKTGTVPAGTYEDCIKFREEFRHTAADLQYADSSYYYVLERLYAPNIGLIREEIVESDVPGLAGAVMAMRQFYIDYQGSFGSGPEAETGMAAPGIAGTPLIHILKMAQKKR